MAVNMTNIDFISSIRMNTLVQTLASELELGAPLTFLNRTPLVPVIDEAEILGSYSGKVFAADLISDDAEAVIVESGKYEMTGRVTAVPNIKLGTRVSQSQLHKLEMLTNNVTLQGSQDLIVSWENNLANGIVKGVRDRLNVMCAAMFLDSMTYDRFGFKISTGFGTPTELKQTLVGGRVWSGANVATMRPIEDLQYMSQSVAPTLGKAYNRVTMATSTFQLIIASNEFAERVRLYLRLDPDQFSLNIYDVPNMRNMFTAITGLTLELEDTTYSVRNVNGTQTTDRVLPADKVMLSNSTDDNDSSKFDFANGIVDESISSRFNANAPDIGGPQVGPVSYFTNNPDLNPPDLVAWGVAKGFPRRHDKNATAIIDVF
jgi:hypothetical protein